VWRRGFPEVDVESRNLGAFLAELPDGDALPLTWRLSVQDDGRNELLALARKPPANLPTLVGLDLSFSYCGDDYLAGLLTGPWLSRLCSLGLGFSALTNVIGQTLTDCPFLARLRVLSFDALHCDEGVSNDFGAEGLAALARSAHLRELRELDLGQNPVGDGGLRALARSRTLTGLTWLNLFDAQVTDKGVAALVTSPVVKHLRYLDLNGQNDLTDATLRALASSAHLTQLETLCLGGEGYSDPDFRLRDGQPLDGRYPAQFTPDGWQAMCESSTLRRLAWLDLAPFESDGEEKTIEALLRARFRSCTRGPGRRAIWS
jgi:hypothetical protein